VPPRRPSAANRKLRGDLEVISLKALEKQRSRRYQSADELAADLRRYRAGDTIAARAPSLLYRASVFTRRYKTLVAAALLVLLSLVVGLVVSLRMYLRSERDRVKAEDAVAVASEVNRFLNEDLLGRADPLIQPDRNLTVREALDAAAEKIEQRFADQAIVKAELLHTIGQAYVNLGGRGANQLQQSVDLMREERGRDDPKVLKFEGDLAAALIEEGKNAEGVRLCQELLPRLEAHYGSHAIEVLQHRANLANALWLDARLQESAEAAQAVLRDLDGVAPGDRDEVHRHSEIIARNALCLAFSDLGRLEEALDVAREQEEVLAGFGDEGHPYLLRLRYTIGSFLTDLGRFAEARTILEHNLEVQRRVQGSEHVDTLGTLNNLALVLKRQGRLAAAEELYLEAVEISNRLLGEDHLDTLRLQANLGRLYWDQDRLGEADELLGPTCDLLVQVAPEGLPLTVTTLHVYGDVLVALDDDEAARPILEMAHHHMMQSELVDPDHERILIDALISVCQRLGDAEAAAAWSSRRPPS